MLQDKRQQIAAYVTETLSFERMILTGLFTLAGVSGIFIFILVRSHADENTAQLLQKGIDIFKDVVLMSLTAIITVLQMTSRSKSAGNSTVTTTTAPPQ